MRLLTWLVLLVFATSCATANSSAQSGNSSGQSANSSAQSGTSAQSGQSSRASVASSDASNASSQSSQQSSASSGQSSNSSRNSSATVQSSGQSSNGTTDAPSSSIVVGSALLLAVVGGIVTTVYTAANRRESKLQQDQLRQLQQAPQPQPMPYKVEPIPLEPGIPPAQQPPPPPPDPGFQPAPFPKKRGSLDAEPSLDAMVMARAWLLANELQLKQDLALGAGPTVEDLAGIAGIPPAHRAHFGRVLQRHRAQLLAPHELTPQQAALVMARVGALVLSDPLLRADADAVLAAW